MQHTQHGALTRVDEGLRLSFLQVIASVVLRFPAQTRKAKSLWDMSAEIYRQTKLGDSLVSALEVLVESDKITAELAIKVLSEVCYPCCRLSTHAHVLGLLVSDISVLCSSTRCVCSHDSSRVPSLLCSEFCEHWGRIKHSSLH